MTTTKDTVLQEFPAIGRYRIRLIKPEVKEGPILDIREYVVGGSFEGFTRRGIRLSVDQAGALAETLGIVKDMLKTGKA